MGAQARRVAPSSPTRSSRAAQVTLEMSTDPAHPVRVKVEEALAKLANDLQTRPETRAVEARRTSCSPTSRSACGSTRCGRRAANAIIRAARNPDAAMAGKARRGAARRHDPSKATRDPLGDQPVRAAWVAGLGRSTAGRSSSGQRDDRGWMRAPSPARLEGAVGRDLQYIRINGTLVGGLVGVILHVGTAFKILPAVAGTGDQRRWWRSLIADPEPSPPAPFRSAAPG